MKKDQSEFLEVCRLKDLAKKHSDYFGFPVALHAERSKEEEDY